MEFHYIGAHCAKEDCNQHDFLPFECKHCAKSFCVKHFNIADHSCPDYVETDRIMPQCPECDQFVPINYGEDADVVLAVHQADGCPAVAKATKLKQKFECSVAGCGPNKGTAVVCSHCSVSTCLAHRGLREHNCAYLASITAPASSASSNSSNSSRSRSTNASNSNATTGSYSNRGGSSRAPFRGAASGLIGSLFRVDYEQSPARPAGTSSTTTAKAADGTVAEWTYADLVREAKGRKRRVPESRRFYMAVTRPSDGTLGSGAVKPVFVDERWSVAKAIDELSDRLDVVPCPGLKLRLFSSDGAALPIHASLESLSGANFYSGCAATLEFAPFNSEPSLLDEARSAAGLSISVGA